MSFSFSLYTQELPETDEEVLAFANKLIHPSFQLTNEENFEFRCDAPDFERLSYAMNQEGISASTRETIEGWMAESKPNFNKVYEWGIFDIYYYDADTGSAHYVSTSDIQTLAINLDYSYNYLLQEFKKVKTGDDGRITVHVYDMSGNTGGRTYSSQALIEIDNFVAKNECFAKTTPAHELFHRVEYMYGYGSRYEQYSDFWVEGLASWAQQFTYPSINDIVSPMNNGLGDPDTNLIHRSYDCAHFWVYLTERYLEQYTDQPDASKIIKKLLKKYKKEYEGFSLIKEITTKYFDQKHKDFIREWHMTNILKDTTNISDRYNYDLEGVTQAQCNYVWILGNVDIENQKFINSNSDTWNPAQGTVEKGGAEYYRIYLNNVDQLRIDVDASEGAKIYVTVISIESDIAVSSEYQKGQSTSFTLNSLNYDQVLVIVSGWKGDGTYQLSVNDFS